MLCERCNMQNATVHLQQTFNGGKTDIYLCANCAGENELGISFGNLFQGFLESFFGSQANLTFEKKGETAEHSSLKCDSCGLTYDSFKKTSKLGCSSCYTAFKKELEYIIKNIQGSNVHEGKFPKRSGQEFIQKREIERLRLKLKNAIEGEEYEAAAKIRDEIRERSASDGQMV